MIPRQYPVCLIFSDEALITIETTWRRYQLVSKSVVFSNEFIIGFAPEKYTN
jgi:hypothetical protein